MAFPLPQTIEYNMCTSKGIKAKICYDDKYMPIRLSKATDIQRLYQEK